MYRNTLRKTEYAIRNTPYPTGNTEYAISSTRYPLYVGHTPCIFKPLIISKPLGYSSHKQKIGAKIDYIFPACSNSTSRDACATLPRMIEQIQWLFDAKSTSVTHIPLSVSAFSWDKERVSEYDCGMLCWWQVRIYRTCALLAWESCDGGGSCQYACALFFPCQLFWNAWLSPYASSFSASLISCNDDQKATKEPQTKNSPEGDPMRSEWSKSAPCLKQGSGSDGV